MRKKLLLLMGAVFLICPELLASGTSWIGFKNYGMVMQRGAYSQLTLQSTDNTGSLSAVGTDTLIELAAKKYDMATYPYPVDTDASFSMSGETWVSITSVTIPAGQSSVTFFYKTGTTENYSIIETSFTVSGSQNTNQMWVTLVNGGIMNAYVHNGNFAQNASLTIGTDETAYIDFSLQDSNINWQVIVSTSTDRSAPAIWTYWGWGYPSPGQVSWNGYLNYYDMQSGVYHSEKAAKGNYYVRIQLGNSGNFVNDTLSIKIESSEITGKVTDAGASGIEGVSVTAYGPSYSYAVTDANGNYTLGGLRSGVYTLNYNCSGFSPATEYNVSAGSVKNVTLSKPAYIKISARRGVSASISDSEAWGNIQLLSSDYMDSYWGSLHFTVDISSSDNGQYNESIDPVYTVENTTGNIWTGGKWTIIEVKPGTYNLTANLGGYDAFAKSGINVASGEIKEITDVYFALPKTVYGTVTLPEAVADGWGAWVSIEAIPEGYSYGTAWGWAQINSGTSSSQYTITGLSAGKYTLRTYSPGYRRKSAAISIASSDEVITGPTLALDNAGTLSGTITVEGDTNDASVSQYLWGDPYTLYLNAWSPDTYSYGWTQVTLAKNASSASTTFTIKGVDDGTYWINSWLYGFDLEGAVGWNGVKTTVAGGSGTVNLKFKRFSGRIKCTFKVPGNDWDNLTVSINGTNIWVNEISHTNFDMYGIDFNEATGVMTTPALGTGFYQIKAKYNLSGMEKTKNVMVINGQTKEIEADLTANTYTVSGKVTLNKSNLPKAGNYTYNEASVFLSSATFVSGGMPLKVTAVEYSKASLLTGGAGVTGLASSKYDEIASDGSYSITGLVPGVYILKIDACELDGNSLNGKESAALEKVVIVNSSKTEDLEISKGYTLSGKIKLGSGQLSAARDFGVYLFKAKQFKVSGFGSSTDSMWSRYVQNTYVSMAAGSSSGDYSFKGLAPGDYVVTINDWSGTRQYVNAAVNVSVASSDVGGKDITLSKGGKITFKLRDANSGTVITPANMSKMLPSTFMVSAIANPWMDGGWGSLDNVAGTGTGKDYFEIPFLPEATYDLILGQSVYGNMGSASMLGETGMTNQNNQGNKTSYAQKTISSVKIKNGQSNELGTIDIKQGLSISGSVKDANGVGIPNVPVVAVPAMTNEWSSQLRGFTDMNGNYSIVGLDPDTGFYDIIACPRMDLEDLGGYYFYGAGGLSYGEKVRSMVKIAETPVVNFTLDEANGSVKGIVTTEDGGAMQNPDDFNLPTAKIYMQRDDTFPRTNPVGDIVADTEVDGSFEIGALAPGTYNLLVISGGYASHSKTVTISKTDTEKDLGTITLKRGAKIAGNITKPNGTNPSTTEVRTVIAATDDFSELLYGSLKISGEKTVTGYELNGFQAGSSYNIVFLSEGDELVPAETAYTVPYSTYTKTDKNLVFQLSAPAVFSKAKRDAANKNKYTMTFDLTGALRKSIPADDDLTNIMTSLSGNGTISDRYMSPNRKSLSCVYTAPAGETHYTLRLHSYSRTLDPTTGSEFEIDASFIYYSGVGAMNRMRVSNLRGAKVTLDGDSSSVQFSPGSFNVGSSTSVEVTFSRADNQSDFNAAPPVPGRKSPKLTISKQAAAYPSEIYEAIALAQKAEINPFSSFYQISIPATISHTLKKDATLTLQCDAGVDPTTLNIYYYYIDPVTKKGAYLLENKNKSVDATAQTITININHVSIFVAFQSNAPVITGTAYDGPLFVYNFPNPFDLTQKTVTLANGPLGSQTQTINGTCIHYGLPTDVSGDVEIKIYNVAGELVRTIADLGKAAGNHYYIEWDGKNDSGSKVASGVYIARFTADKKNQKFFKMAVIK